MLWQRRWLPISGTMRNFASDTASFTGLGSPMRDPDEGGFAAKVVPHTSAMLRVAASLVGVSDAEDAAQEAILRAWQAWPRLRDHSAVRAWLLRITVNVCQQWLRGELGKRKRFNSPLLPENAEWLPALDGDPGDSDHAAALDLRRALARLSPELRTVITLRYYGGMSAEEIGEALSHPTRTIHRRLREAYDQLRDHLQPPDAQEEDVHG
jgi:RNA polymerase sigma-70 factor (ECF subfamily)